MIEWSESQPMIWDAIRRFVEAEVAPHVEELEHRNLPRSDMLRKMLAAFGMDWRKWPTAHSFFPRPGSNGLLNFQERNPRWRPIRPKAR